MRRADDFCSGFILYFSLTPFPIVEDLLRSSCFFFHRRGSYLCAYWRHSAPSPWSSSRRLLHPKKHQRRWSQINYLKVSPSSYIYYAYIYIRIYIIYSYVVFFFGIYQCLVMRDAQSVAGSYYNAVYRTYNRKSLISKQLRKVPWLHSKRRRGGHLFDSFFCN